MRVVLYLLALLTGFSAAEAARPVQPAHNASLVASTAVAVAANHQQDIVQAVEGLGERVATEAFPAISIADSDSAGFATPVERNDLAHN